MFKRENDQLDRKEAFRQTDAQTGKRSEKNEQDRILFEIKNTMSTLTGMSIDDIDDNKTFLAQGFDSLLVTQANSALQKQFSMKLSLQLLFETASTPGKLAKYLKSNIPETGLREIGISGQPTCEEDGNSDRATTIENAAQEAINSLQSILNQDINYDFRPELEEALDKQKLIIAYLRNTGEETESIGVPRPGKTSELSAKDMAITRVQRDGRLPLSFAQQRLWYLDQMEPNQSVYNLPSALRMTGNLDIEILTRCINEIINRHEILRTRFNVEDGNPTLIINSPTLVELPLVDFSEIQYDEREKRLEYLLVSEARKPFNLEKGPLFYSSLIRLSGQEHILFFATHHSISDGWSLSVFWQEIAALYDAYKNDRPSPLPKLGIQYVDFSVWQRNMLKGEELKRQLSYWESILDGDLPVLDMMTDYPRPTVQTYNGSTTKVHLSSQLIESLEGIAKDEDATLFIVLLTAFKILLRKYTGQNDIIVGSPIANRTLHEIENLIGFFANTLVFRTQFDGDMIFRELLIKVRDVCFGAYDHQDMPFEKLVEEINPARDLSRTPIFQAMFGYMDTSNRATQMADITLEPVRIDNATAKTDMTLFLSREGKEVNGVIEYNTDLFNADTVQRIVTNFNVLLNGIALNPDDKIDAFPIMSISETQRVLVEWNNTFADFQGVCIHNLFEEQVEKSPNAVAVIYEEQSLSYLELNCRANQLAHALREQGVGTESLVSLYMERSLEMVVALFGVLKAGGAYLPIDTTHPQERLALILEDAQVDIVLTMSAQQERLVETGVKTICLDLEWQKMASYNDSNPVNQCAPKNLAYVIYTSGSTGKPKGVQVQHDNVVNFLASMGKKPGLCDEDRLLAVTTLSFDIAVLEIYLPLVNGARVIIAGREAVSDGQMLRDLVEGEGITAMQATPTTWRMLLAVGWRGSSMFKVLCGGEAFPKDLANELLDCGLNVWNMYGPTETTVWSSCYPIANADSPILIGRPIDNTAFYVLDANEKPLPIGIWGELYIGGAGVTRGYLNQSDLTNERYIPDPFSKKPDDRLYKTGDLVRYLPDGNIEFMGRIDNQVKIRGYSIELGEIESNLTKNPGVNQTVVITREDEPGNKRLVAYIVPEEEAIIKPPVLRNYLKEKLPEYMVPSIFVMLTELPLTPNGKVDRKMLPKPERNYHEEENTFAEPRNDFELQLTKIWEKVLDVQPVGIKDNFFELGGHSLLVVRLINEIKRSTGKNLSVKDFFHSQTILQLSESLMSEDPSETSSLIMIKPL